MRSPCRSPPRAPPRTRCADRPWTSRWAREEYGLDTEALLQAQWARDNWYEGDEKEFLDFAHKQGWEAATVRNLVYDYARAMQGSMGEITDEMVADFHQRYAGKIPAADREALVAGIRGES